MSGDETTSRSAGGAGLLERAIGYLLGILATVTHGDLSRPTPCARWNLGQLLVHLDDSLSALRDAGGGLVDLDGGPFDGDGPIDLVARLRSRASDALGVWVGEDGVDPAVVGGCPVSAGLMVAAGALEVAVHAWDIAVASGGERRIPPPLAEDLLAVAAWAVSPADRPIRFATPLPVSPLIPADERLLALLGRQVRHQDPTFALP